MLMLPISSLLACIVLLASTGLLIWSLRNTGAGCFLGKIVGSVVLFLSALSILYSGYTRINHWWHGGFERPMSMPMGMGMGMGMPHQGMPHPGMMPHMMENMMGNAGNPAQAAQEEDDD